ncbi:hypothetical protein [Eubacterium sp. An3]|uniref:hypothetical protein n=1 Tax=Eubacterium sp. An3 TaxID=1965628 RepID=UPI000B380C91|nr:hypothetical protein [Eubacterium sp. An3]OUO24906.1 hypothetical protein B5F87_18805 [Eubacterium sp. An3]
MLSDKYISDSELNRIKLTYCDKIILFMQFRKDILKWYQAFDFQYPHSSENNYRDSWFHYRKIYQEHSAYEIICQSANFEEHLQRAEKDAIVYFWQKICGILEVWYFLDENKEFGSLSDSEKEEISNICTSTNGQLPDNWVLLLQHCFCCDVSQFKYACVYVVQNYIFQTDFKNQLQILLHKIKSVVLNMRMNGAEIQREDRPGSYMNLCQNIYNELEKFCNRYCFAQIISITENIDVSMQELEKR